MPNDPFFYVMTGSVLLVLLVLLFGLGTFTKGGEFNRKYANKIMRVRVGAQAVAVALILAYVYFRRQGG